MDFLSWSRLARNLVPVIFFPFKLNLRLKALKRQMDEAEEEIDRLEHSKKKLQRDLDEQQEANEQLQSQLKALKTEIRSTIQNQKRITASEKQNGHVWIIYQNLWCVFQAQEQLSPAAEHAAR